MPVAVMVGSLELFPNQPVFASPLKEGNDSNRGGIKGEVMLFVATWTHMNSRIH